MFALSSSEDDDAAGLPPACAALAPMQQCHLPTFTPSTNAGATPPSLLLALALSLSLSLSHPLLPLTLHTQQSRLQHSQQQSHHHNQDNTLSLGSSRPHASNLHTFTTVICSTITPCGTQHRSSAPCSQNSCSTNLPQQGQTTQTRATLGLQRAHQLHCSCLATWQLFAGMHMIIWPIKNILLHISSEFTEHISVRSYLVLEIEMHEV